MEKIKADFAHFRAVREFVGNGCRLHRLRQQGQLNEAQQETEKVWLRERYPALRQQFLPVEAGCLRRVSNAQAGKLLIRP